MKTTMRIVMKMRARMKMRERKTQKKSERLVDGNMGRKHRSRPLTGKRRKRKPSAKEREGRRTRKRNPPRKQNQPLVQPLHLPRNASHAELSHLHPKTIQKRRNLPQRRLKKTRKNIGASLGMSNHPPHLHLVSKQRWKGREKC